MIHMAIAPDRIDPAHARARVSALNAQIKALRAQIKALEAKRAPYLEAAKRDTEA